MSRQSLVRDAIVSELKDRISNQAIETFVVPHYSRKDLSSGPRICVRSGSRELAIDQGPDTRDVVVEIGVVGVTRLRESTDEATYRLGMVDDCDTFDELMETIIAMWTPNGPLSQCGMADHRFVSIEQAINFDPQKLYDDGIWLSMIRLTYQDTFDD